MGERLAMRSYWGDRSELRALLTGLFASVFVGGLAIVAALWCLAALLVGTVVLAQMVSEAVR